MQHALFPESVVHFFVFTIAEACAMVFEDPIRGPCEFYRNYLIIKSVECKHGRRFICNPQKFWVLGQQWHVPTYTEQVEYRDDEARMSRETRGREGGTRKEEEERDSAHLRIPARECLCLNPA